MPSEKVGAQRKVFMLETELVDRVLAYQEKNGLQSEVEAVRQLLNDALRLQDEWWSICDQVVERMKRPESLINAAKDIVLGHPKVSNVAFELDRITFKTITGEHVEILLSGEVAAESSNGTPLPYPEL